MSADRGVWRWLRVVGGAVLRTTRRDRVTAEAARIAYYAFLSLFPFLLVLFSLTGLIGGDGAFAWIMRQLALTLPTAAFVLVEDFVREATSTWHPGVLSLSLVLTLYLASGVFAALFDGLNMAYNVRRKRRWWRKRAMALVLLVAALAAMVGSAIALLVGPELSRLLGMPSLASALRWPVVFLVGVGMLWLIYYFLPYHDQSRSKRRVLVGALVGAILWAAISVLFRLYVGRLSGVTPYGYIWGGMLLLVWLYLSSLSVLIGGHVAAELERRAMG